MQLSRVAIESLEPRRLLAANVALNSIQTEIAPAGVVATAAIDPSLQLFDEQNNPIAFDSTIDVGLQSEATGTAVRSITLNNAGAATLDVTIGSNGAVDHFDYPWLVQFGNGSNEVILAPGDSTSITITLT